MCPEENVKIQTQNFNTSFVLNVLQNVAPLTPSAPVNSLEMSNNMFKLYFDQDSQGVHEPEDFLEYFR